MSPSCPDDPRIERALQALGIDAARMRRPRDGHSAVVRFLELDDGSEAVLKIPSNASKYGRELAALSALAGHLPVPAVLATAAWHDDAALLLERLPGEPPSEADLTGPTLEQIGRLLARLHAEPVPAAVDTHSPWEALLDPLAERLATCRRAAPHTRWDRVEAGLRHVADEPPPLAPPVRAHFDPLPANFLFRDGRLTGVIDFESSRIAPPEVDLALLANGVSAQRLTSVLAGYEAVHERPERLAASLPALRVCGAVAAAAFSFRKGRRSTPFIARQLGNIDSCLPQIRGS